MTEMKRIGVDLFIGVAGVVSGLSLEKALAICVAVSTIVLIWVRIWLLLRNRDHNEKDD